MQDFFNRFFGGQGGQGGGDDDDDSGPAGSENVAHLDRDSSWTPAATSSRTITWSIRLTASTSAFRQTPKTIPGRPAHVIGVDKDTDLAVIKIDALTPLPTVKLGNSDGAQVGDWVLAIGSPVFSLSQTVTAGIVSAKNRVDPSGGSQQPVPEVHPDGCSHQSRATQAVLCST